METIEQRPASRSPQKVTNKTAETVALYLTDISRSQTEVTRLNHATRKLFTREDTLFLSDDETEPDPPRKRPEANDIKIQLYLRECEKLRVIPISAYLRNPTKNALVISHYNIGPNGARALAVPLLLDNNLSYLDIEGNSISPIGLASIQEALTENVYITHLNIADNKLGNKGAQLVGLMMSTNHTIESLNAARNGFRDLDAPIFAKIIKENRILKVLVLAGNQFGDHAGSAFGNALRSVLLDYLNLVQCWGMNHHTFASNETLEIFDLSWNHIRKRSAVEFASGIKENVGLKKLNVSFNGFGTEGTAVIAQALSTNRTLQELDLSKNRITDIDVKILASQLPNNDTLRVLKLGSNVITHVGTMDVLRGLQKAETSSLEIIDFGSASVTEEFLEVLDELKEQRNIKCTFGIVQRSLNLPKSGDDIEGEGTESSLQGEEGEGETGEGGKKKRDKTYVVNKDKESEAGQDVEVGKEDGKGREGESGGTDEKNGEKADAGEGEKSTEDKAPSDQDGVEFDEETLDNEVKAVTGEPDTLAQQQKAVVMETESTGTLTPDI